MRTGPSRAHAIRSHGRPRWHVGLSGVRVLRLLVATLWFGGLVLDSSAASAQYGDGVYRRWDSDVAFALEASGGVWLDGDQASPAVSVGLRARIADAAGPVVTYRWASDGGEGATRGGDALMVGIEVRPLWPALFLTDNATGREWLDLFLQSFAVELGAVFTPLATEGERGVGLAVGVSIDLPLMLPTHTRGTFRGISLRLGARRIDATRSFAGTPDDVDRSGWLLTAGLTATLGGGSGPTREPRRYRPRAFR